MTRPFPPLMEGSSPLTRGKPAGREHSLAPMRLIPAHAGKTESEPASASARAAHPRSRGENVQWPTNSITRMGSSPLTRGKRRPTDDPQPRNRLIPAHAGKTVNPSPTSSSTSAHPRSRGENVIAAIAALVAIGSSPLTRGKQDSMLAISVRSRLIPAHAGKTFPSCRPQSR